MAGLYHPLDQSKNEIRLLKLAPRRDGAEAQMLLPEMRQIMADWAAAHCEDGSTMVTSEQEKVMSAKVEAMTIKLRRFVDNPSEPLQGTLETVSLDNAPEFVALSYVWGSSITAQQFLLNDTLTSITENLDDALRQLQRFDRELVLWVDNLCIDQQSAIDKSEQVMLMRKIYSAAQSVAVWLGRSDADIEAVLDFLDKSRDQFMQLYDVIGQVKSSNIYTILESQPQIREFFESEARLQLARGINKILNKEYWYRVWVMQEFCVGKELVIHCGHRTISAELLRAGSYVITGLMNSTMISMGQLTKSLTSFVNGRNEGAYTVINSVAALRMFLERMEYQASEIKGSRPLMSSIMMFLSGDFTRTALRATDLRDKIYALLGTAQDQESLGIVVDYTQSVQQVYLQATVRILERGQLDYLQLCTFSARSNWPSWIPDLTRNVQITPNNATSIDKPFRASGQRLPTSLPHLTPLKQRELHIEAARVDIIREIGLPVNGPQADSMRMIGLVKASLQQAKSFFRTAISTDPSNTNQSYRSSKSSEKDSDNTEHWIQEAAMRLLTADQEYADLGNGAKTRVTDLTRTRFATLLDVIAAYDKVNEDASIATEEKPARFWESASEHIGYFDMYLIGVQLNVHRRLFLTAGGLVGIAPPCAMVGDEVVILIGASLPYIIREATGEDAGSYKLIGDAYVHGSIMDGEFLSNEHKIETIILT